MRQFETEALLLDVSDLHDRDRIITFLTSQFGTKRGVAPGARRKYSRYAGQLQPLATLKLSWVEKDHWDLVRIRDAQVVRIPRRLMGELECILLGAYLAEHVIALVLENESGDLYYRLLDATIEAVEAGIDLDVAARYFEFWSLRLAGVFPDLSVCSICGRELDGRAVVVDSGEAVACPSCVRPAATNEPMSASGLSALGAFRRRSLIELAQQLPPPAALRDVERLCGVIRRQFLERELKSYEVMRETLRQVVGTP